MQVEARDRRQLFLGTNDSYNQALSFSFFYSVVFAHAMVFLNPEP